VLDMRTTYDIINAHFNYNFKYDNQVPIPSDYVVENKLDMKDFAKWVPNMLFKEEEMNKFNLVNKEKLDKFTNRKRLYVFVIASQTRNID
jgi:hypothetical protein